MHRWKTVPVIRPAGQPHILLVGAAQELDFAKFAAFDQILHIKELPRVDHRFHHHVNFAGLFFGLHKVETFLGSGRHRHGAGGMFASLQGGK